MDEAESFADLLLRTVRMDGALTPCPRLVARRWGVAVYRAPRSLRFTELAERALVHGEDRIYMRADIDPHLEAHVLGHELGHVAVSRWHIRPEDEEAWCNRFGAALVAPGPSVWRSWRRTGTLRSYLSAWKHVPATFVALRLGEIGCADVWVTQSRSIRYARAAHPMTGDVMAAGIEASARGSARRPGLHAVRLNDAPRRAAVLSREDCA